MWRWDQQEPFGNNVPDENPSGLGVFDLPLRLPGQYFDKETNFAYNLTRDYDASLGRYIQSDRVGLRGGLNTFTYVRQSPLLATDPSGLCPCNGGVWKQGTNFAASFFAGAGGSISINAKFTCKSNPKLRCKANMICLGGGLIAGIGAGADLFGEVGGIPDTSYFDLWTNSFTWSVGPVSGNASTDGGSPFDGTNGGGSVSVMKSIGGGAGLVACTAYHVRCDCPCSQ